MQPNHQIKRSKIPRRTGHQEYTEKNHGKKTLHTAILFLYFPKVKRPVRVGTGYILPTQK